MLALGAVACGPKPRPALPPAPSVSSAAEFIPPDLDVVVRLDLARVKATLGGAALTALSRQVLTQGSPKQSVDELMVASLLEARVVFFGFRPSATGTPLDRVLALEGSFTQLVQTPGGFSRATDLGADVRYWDASATPPREGVARIYAAGERMRAFVSEAELDAMDRMLEGRASAERLEAPAEGTLSLAARPALLARLSGSGLLRELLNGAKRFTAIADLESDGARLKAELVLETAQQAEALAGAAKLVLGRLMALPTGKLELRAEAERVLFDAQLGADQLRPLWEKWGGG